MRRRRPRACHCACVHEVRHSPACHCSAVTITLRSPYLLSSMWNNVVNAWWPLVFYPATDAPKFHQGMIAMICVAVATLAVTWLMWRLERREWHLQAQRNLEDDDGGSKRVAEGTNGRDLKANDG